MSHQIIRDLLRVRLNAIPGGSLPTAWENIPFTPGIIAWQKVDMLWARTENPTMGTAFKREVGIMQVTLSYPTNAGPDPAALKAGSIINWFPRGYSMFSGTLRVLIDRSAYISVAMVNGNWYTLPVSIPFIGDVFT